jgi:hypothetical protein
MIVLICGDRNWTNRVSIRKVLRQLKGLYGRDLLVIQGGAPGADTIAKEEAMALGITVCTYPANWAVHHRAAGPIRNAEQLKWGRPMRVFAFHPNLQRSRGTRDMVTKAERAGLKVIKRRV